MCVRITSLHHGVGAFTLLEVLVAVGIAGLLASVSGTSYVKYLQKARVARAIAEIDAMAHTLDDAHEDGVLPDSLSGIERGGALDPWGHPYAYLKIAGNLPRGISQRFPGGSPLPPVASPPLDRGNDSGGAPGGGGGGGGSIMGQVRKDRFLVPINSDYDLYSVGADGESQPPLHNRASLDDVIRAGDGSFLGLAQEF